MIIKINIETFFSEDDNILRNLTKIIELGIEEKYLWNTENIDEFFDKIIETRWFTKHLSPIKQDDFIEILESIYKKDAYITENHLHYLTNITIGLSSNEINPEKAYLFLSKPSKIVLENSTNDWKFIKGITHKYSKSSKRKNIYKLLYKAIISNQIEPENAGGKGGVKQRIIDLEVRYGKIFLMKIATVFDSDKKSKNEEFSQTTKNLIGFLKEVPFNETNSDYSETDLCFWHILDKREIENYLSPEIIEYHFPTERDNCEILKQLDKEILNYYDYESIFKDIDVKNEFPKLFLSDELKRNDLEQVCKDKVFKIEFPNSRTLADVSEIEYLLTNLAKII